MKQKKPADPVGNTLISGEDIARRNAELGKAISADYAGRRLLLIGVLKGAFMFMSDLMREIKLPVSIDFLAVSSYGAGTRSSGEVRILKDLDTDIGGRDVLLVEDVVDSGLTLQYLLGMLRARSPASLEICALLVKADSVIPPEYLKYVGFPIPREFVIGYGLDLDEKYRSLSHISVYEDPESVRTGGSLKALSGVLRGRRTGR